MWWIGIHLPALSLESFIATFPAESGPVEAAPGLDWPEPVLLLERQRVVAVNEAAQARGIGPGQRRATALALAPHARCGEADPARDAAALQAVACALLEFTPAVSLGGPDTVLAEVEASLRYFGGLAALLTRLRAALAPLGHRVQVAVAPTPQAALWLSNGRDDAEAVVADAPAPRRARPPSLAANAEAAASVAADARRLGLPTTDAGWRARLEAVPVACVVAAQPSLARLDALGLHTVAQLRRQPRDGLARRFGAALLDEIDAALGDRADPRDALVPPAVFDSRLELFARAESSEALLAGAGVLLSRLVAWARALHGRIAGFRLTLHPETRQRLRDLDDGGRTVLDLVLAEPLADAAHLHALLRERLQRLPLAAPVIEMSLHCDQLVPGAPPNTELFPSASSLREGWQRLLERLEARLGPGQLQQLEAVDDHRPERATRVRPGSVAAAVAAAARRPRGGAKPVAKAEVKSTQAVARVATRPSSPSPAGTVTVTDVDTSPAIDGPSNEASSARPDPAAAPRQRRPTWLLPTPQPLTERQGVPCLAGQPLVLLAGPERIESGWWDGDLVARDYFVAQAADGTLLWVYRYRHAPEGREAAWHLQGRFG
jgi:protein ImuB